MNFLRLNVEYLALRPIMMRYPVKNTTFRVLSLSGTRPIRAECEYKFDDNNLIFTAYIHNYPDIHAGDYYNVTRFRITNNVYHIMGMCAADADSLRNYISINDLLDGGESSIIKQMRYDDASTIDNNCNEIHVHKKSPLVMKR